MIEILESRIAPAAVFYFTDVDGDHVKISSSLGTNTELAAAVTLGNAAQAAVGKPHQLEMLTLGSDFAGASISITATPSNDLNTASPVKSGDGFVNVGMINAPAIDLKSVTIHGDLGQIIVGDSNPKTLGLGSLNVQSMGDFGLTTGANSVNSRFENGVGSITIAHDVNGVLLRAIATGSATTAKIGSIYIGGNLIGGTTSDTGEIAADDGMGNVKIMGSVIGGSATNTGRIASTVGGNIASIYIGGNLIGGTAQTSGVLYSSADIGTVKIVGSIIGGTVTDSGRIETSSAGGNIGNITIGGDLIGGTAAATGNIYSPANIGNVAIHGSVLGGSAGTTGGIYGANVGAVTIGGDLRGIQFSSTTAAEYTAYVHAQTNLKSVTIGGSVVSGQESGGGALTFSGAIQAGQTLGPVKVLGSVLGNLTSEVVISGAGLAAVKGVKHDLAVTSVSVKESATFMQIEAGYDLSGNAASGDAQMGAITIGGDLIASDIIAGVKSSKGYFGDPTDTMIAKPSGDLTDGILATIASITVGGQIEGTTATANTFGIEAQLIGSIKTGGVALPLTKGSGNDDFMLGATTGKDVHVREFAGT